jgi:hypothetical protein
MGEIKVTFPQEAGVVFEVQKAFSKSTLGVEIRVRSNCYQLTFDRLLQKVTLH